jgi:glycosyltransferase involved in cell wall biosynthesis
MELWQGRAASAVDSRYFQFPLIKRAVERARAVVVHNPAAARAVHEHAPETPVVEIPHFFPAPAVPDQARIARYRQELGVAPDTFLFGIFGYLRESKRLGSVLEAFPGLPGKAALLVAGKFISSDLERALEPLLRQPGVVRLPYLSPDDLWLASFGVDACINLRYPAAGETSGITIRMMGIGKPVVITDAEECSRFPEDAVIRITPGVEERDSLRYHMSLLTSLPEVARAVGERGARHIREHHQMERIARLYWDTLCAHSV